jgi:hypothetical protein
MVELVHEMPPVGAGSRNNTAIELISTPRPPEIKNLLKTAPGLIAYLLLVIIRLVCPRTSRDKAR